MSNEVIARANSIRDPVVFKPMDWRRRDHDGEELGAGADVTAVPDGLACSNDGSAAVNVAYRFRSESN